MNSTKKNQILAKVMDKNWRCLLVKLAMKVNLLYQDGMSTAKKKQILAKFASWGEDCLKMKLVF